MKNTKQEIHTGGEGDDDGAISPSAGRGDTRAALGDADGLRRDELIDIAAEATDAERDAAADAAAMFAAAAMSL